MYNSTERRAKGGGNGNQMESKWKVNGKEINRIHPCLYIGGSGNPFPGHLLKRLVVSAGVQPIHMAGVLRGAPLHDRIAQ